MMSTRKIWVVGILVVAVGTIFFYATREEAVLVNVGTPTRRNIKEMVEGAGILNATHQVEITPDVSGEIVELYVEKSQHVTEGTLLLRIRPDSYVSILDKQRAQYAKAEVSVKRSLLELNKARVRRKQEHNNFTRQKKIYDSCMLSEAEFDRALSSCKEQKNNYRIAKSNLAATKYELASVYASVRQAEESLALTNIYAPITGIVTYLEVEEGERVVGTMQSRGTSLLTISRLDDISVDVSVNENDIHRVKVGQVAFVRVESLLAYVPHIAARVGQISYLADRKVSQDAPTEFSARIDILAASYASLMEQSPIAYPLRPGISAEVKIVVSEKKNILSVLTAAVIARLNEEVTQDGQSPIFHAYDENIMEAVFIYKDGRAYLRRVETGVADLRYVEIIAGIAPNDTIITGPYELLVKRLQDGQVVRAAMPAAKKNSSPQ